MDTSIEEIREYWSAQPCNVKHSSAPVGSAQWSDEVTKRKYFVEPHIRDFARFPKWCGKRVLEIGCGIGTDTLQFLYHGAHVDAIDISGESILLAESRCKGASDVVFYQTNAEEYLPNYKYDLIYSFGVLHHTPCPKRVLKLAYERLKDDGELRIMLYAKWSIKNLLGEQPEAQANCPLAKTYTVQQSRELVELAGFRVRSIKKDHIFPYEVEAYKRYEYKKRLIYRWMPKWLFSWLERKLGWHLLIICTK